MRFFALAKLIFELQVAVGDAATNGLLTSSSYATSFLSPSLPVSAALGSPWQRILAVADMSLWRLSVNKCCFN